MANETIQYMMNRTSVRHFTGEKIDSHILKTILRAAQQAPTSINGQQISVIYTQDKTIIEQIAQIAGGQPQIAAGDVFVTIVADFYRTGQALKNRGKEQKFLESIDAILTGSVDAGIMVEAISTAAESFGIGNTIIGGIRRDPQAMIDLLQLPEQTFPIVGIILGMPDKEKASPVKPRVAFESFAMENVYDRQKVVSGVVEYDDTLSAYFNKQGISRVNSYSTSLELYTNKLFDEERKVIKKQGFSID